MMTGLAPLLVIAVAMQQTPPALEGVTDPEILGDPQTWVTTEDYPPDAAANGITGETYARLDVGADGRVTNCTVVISSGNTALDSAACRAMTARARFAPARDRQGVAVPSTFMRRVRWALPDDEPVAEPVSGYSRRTGLALRLHIGTDGLIRECQAVTATIPPQRHPNEANICAQARRRWARDPATRVPPGGLWIEERQERYLYDSNPGWPDPVPAPEGSEATARPQLQAPLQPEET